MGFSLLPKEYEFFDMFDKLTAYSICASKFLQEIVEHGTRWGRRYCKN